ncbi:phage protein Gp27 family protein [Paracoccus sp. (in: a-proteobacteria)]|uniref:phage protein Gp27 family protein n=1 Tax=Paracoccus sp. TaxID=267 RepID=UPI00272C92F8|nr:phage protein Gp27 family protein [Paracoccus sp. (in: a-proteobacteria)]
MPPPRKVDQLPPEIRAWLQDTLRERGFADYVAVTEELNDKLAEAGKVVTFHHATVHRFSQEYRAFVKTQETASAWAQEWMTENGLEEEAKRHNVLFQMVTALAFKAMEAKMEKDGDEIDPKELHFIGRMLKDIMASAGIRQSMLAAERKMQAEKLEAAVEAGDIDAEAAAKARRIMGFA